MNVFLFLLPALIAALISYALTPLTARLALRIGAVDEPNSRKIHQQPIPRLGGLAVVIGVAAALGSLFVFHTPGNGTLIHDYSFLLGLGIGFLPILAISFWDDVKPLRPAPKFLAQTVGAVLAISFGIQLGPEISLFGNAINLGVWAIPISIVWIVGATNAFNLVDGLDGLSAGLAFISAMSLAGVSALVGLYGMTFASLILAGALLGFLPYNVYPAKVFLGDTGSTAIGFCLACLALEGGSTLTAGMAVLVPIVVMGLPVAEALISMLRRALRNQDVKGSSIFEADREHIHHRLLALGFDHRRAVLMLYAVGIALALCGFGSLFFNHHGAAVLLLTLLIAAFIGVKRLGYDEFALVRRGVVLRAYDAPVLKASLFSVFVDVAMVVLAIYAAIVMKFDDWGLNFQRPLAEFMMTLLPLITLIVFFSFRLYRGSWRQASMEDLLRSTWAVLVSSAIGYGVCALSLPERPRLTFFAVYTLILLALVNGVRASYRLLHHWTHRAASDGAPVLIYGAGRAGSLALRELLSNTALGMRPIGFIDDDPHKVGKIVNGFPVLATMESIEKVLAREKVSGLLVASEKIDRSRISSLQRSCAQSSTWIRRFRIEFRPVDFELALMSVEAVGERAPSRELDDLVAPGILTASEVKEWSDRILMAEERALRGRHADNEPSAQPVGRVVDLEEAFD